MQLHLQGLTKHYPGVAALGGIDLDDIAAAFWDRATAPVAAVALEGNG